MTEIKCIHVDSSSGRLAADVSCLISTVEMLPVTFKPLSTPATDVRPSSFMRIRASARGGGGGAAGGGGGGAGGRGAAAAAGGRPAAGGGRGAAAGGRAARRGAR